MWSAASPGLQPATPSQRARANLQGVADVNPIRVLSHGMGGGSSTRVCALCVTGAILPRDDARDVNSQKESANNRAPPNRRDPNCGMEGNTTHMSPNDQSMYMRALLSHHTAYNHRTLHPASWLSVLNLRR